MTTRKRERPLLDVGLMPLGVNTPELAKDVSPRILPPPPWLTGNLKVTAQGKTTQIGKRGITDWKSVGTITTAAGAAAAAATTTISGSTTNGQQGAMTKSTTAAGDPSCGNNEFLLPNCPGATASPYKGNKKKLSPMISTDNHHYILQNGTTPVISMRITPAQPIDSKMILI